MFIICTISIYIVSDLLENVTEICFGTTVHVYDVCACCFDR